MQVYRNGFDNWSDVQNAYQTSDTEEGKVVLFADYEQGNYEGWSTVVWSDHRGYWLVEGSHCSCYGLEGQWNPEETPLDVLLHIAETGKYGSDVLQVLRDLKVNTNLSNPV